MQFHTYMLRCADGNYYVGHTDDLAIRIAQHQSGLIAGYTQNRRPVELVWSEQFPDRDTAFLVERQVKGWSRAKKQALIAGDWDGLRLLARKLFLEHSDPLTLSSRSSGVSKGEQCFDTEPSAPTQHERDTR